jgi:uncharacterized protein YoaH (UPF0181 family)
MFHVKHSPFIKEVKQMAEHISREAVEQVLCGIANGLSIGEAEALKAKDVKALYKIKGAKEILNAVDNDLSFIPAADVQPVRRGRWEYIRNVKLSGTIKLCECSICHNKVFGCLNYCGNCGARMIKDGDTNGI